MVYGNIKIYDENIMVEEHDKNKKQKNSYHWQKCISPYLQEKEEGNMIISIDAQKLFDKF